MCFKEKDKYWALSLPETKNNPQEIQAYLNQGTRLRERKQEGTKTT